MLLLLLLVIFSPAFVELQWIPVTHGGTPPSPRFQHSAVVTSSNTMLIFGGYCSSGPNSGLQNDIAKYNISTDSWIPVTPGGTPPTARYGHSAVVTSSNTMLIFGGIDINYVTLNDIAKYNIFTTVVQTTGSGTRGSFSSQSKDHQIMIHFNNL